MQVGQPGQLEPQVDGQPIVAVPQAEATQPLGLVQPVVQGGPVQVQPRRGRLGVAAQVQVGLQRPHQHLVAGLEQHRQPRIQGRLGGVRGQLGQRPEHPQALPADHVAHGRHRRRHLGRQPRVPVGPVCVPQAWLRIAGRGDDPGPGKLPQPVPQRVRHHLGLVQPGRVVGQRGSPHQHHAVIGVPRSQRPFAPGRPRLAPARSRRVLQRFADRLPGWPVARPQGHPQRLDDRHHDRRPGRQQALVHDLPGGGLPQVGGGGEQVGQGAAGQPGAELLLVQQQGRVLGGLPGRRDVGAGQPGVVVDQEQPAHQPPLVADGHAQPAENSLVRLARDTQWLGGGHDALVPEPGHDLAPGRPAQDRLAPHLVDGLAVRGVDNHPLLVVLQHGRRVQPAGQLVDDVLQLRGHGPE